MNPAINPFQNLYQGESIQPDAFIDLFSPVIVEHALSIFQPGNIIVKGLIGSGKSMLLNLLDPEIRVEYENGNKPFPVPKKFSKFIGAGINLKRSGISQFGQRPILENEGLIATPFYFGDFLNYWIVYDILKNIKYLSSCEKSSIAKSSGINFSADKTIQLAKAMAEESCWIGNLNKAESLDDILLILKTRIDSYLNYMNYNGDFPESLRTTKTSIGIPVTVTVKILKKLKIVDDDVQFYVRIDQYEELPYLDEGNSDLGINYQKMINKLLSLRDTSVSYKIGARPNSWQDNAKVVYGSSGILENGRDYNEVDIDKVLRLQEEKKGYVFPQFSEDIFYRRVLHSGYTITEKPKDLLAYSFVSETPSERVLRYVGKNKKVAIKLEKDWPEKFKRFLINLAEEDPISARLGEAWVRQKGKDTYMNDSFTKPYPWENKEKRYWKKERIDQALFQIASRNNQRPVYSGKDEILGLSGGNILAFISLCRHIWDVWIRDNISDEKEDTTLPQFSPAIQGIGIRSASSAWLKDIATVRGGKERSLFINYIGSLLSLWILDDLSMSYPGHNGFSLSIDQYNSEPKIADFLKKASDNGDLYSYPHTSKTKGAHSRIKWYLNPMLSPSFKLTYKHIKEPYYAHIDDVKEWLLKSFTFKDSTRFVNPPQKRNGKNSGPHQLSLL